MKVCLYFENANLIAKSGIGSALRHQREALELAHVDYTLNPNDSYDILHINTIGIKSKEIIHKARREGKPVIYHAHSTEEDIRNSYFGSNAVAPILKKWLINLYSSADYILTPTPYSKSLLLDYGIKVPITPISNGIRINDYQKDQAKINKFREYFKLSPEDKTIICVALPFKRKGILDFVEVAKQFPQYKFIWFGDTFKYLLTHDIQETIKRDHPDNVIFPGFINGDVLTGAYTGCDLFFFPSNEETEGIVVLEALASHSKTLLRDIPVYDPWLSDGVNCYKGKNNEDFNLKIEQIMNNQIPDLTDAGFEVAQERDLASIGQKLKSIYEEVLK
ncbi:glycosyltransferase [Xylocopilactobacillus apicola]|uniref:Glycosyl transferase n=1 Tax=Xylocopilactobacillus apicola TaxID=2932184 RepID=A0AAU9D9M1_9LACO|nr:glycosyltransferase [Xylocopilactobacillus apicola]BDR59060.1 glycosyl transferase [Xylocopilactobacillus apicola]